VVGLALITVVSVSLGPETRNVDMHVQEEEAERELGIVGAVPTPREPVSVR
jgi:hypothetical protein